MRSKPIILIAFVLLLSATLLGQNTPPPPTMPVLSDPPKAAPTPTATPAPAKSEPAPAQPATTPADKEAVAPTPPSVPATPDKPAPIVLPEAKVMPLLLDFVKSDTKWQLGFRHEPYNKISAYAQDKLSKQLATKEYKLANKVEEAGMKVTLELLQVSTRQAIIKDPGIDVAANVVVTSPAGKIIYSKGYKGRSGTYFMNTWGHLINGACDNMVENILKDDVLLTVFRTGKLPE